jgi:phosphoglycolate phosphatase-like HAD superfamily hydrolase
MIRAYERAKAHKNRASFDSVTYVGDAIWDFTASKNLGYSFIAVGTRNQTELRNRGVIHIMDDLIDKDYFFKILGITNNYV